MSQTFNDFYLDNLQLIEGALEKVNGTPVEDDESPNYFDEALMELINSVPLPAE